MFWGQPGKPSFRVDWEAALATRPDVVLIMPCGYSLAGAEAEFCNLPLPRGWKICPPCAMAACTWSRLPDIFRGRARAWRKKGLKILADESTPANRSALHQRQACHCSRALPRWAKILARDDSWRRRLAGGVRRTTREQEPPARRQRYEGGGRLNCFERSAKLRRRSLHHLLKN